MINVLEFSALIPLLLAGIHVAEFVLEKRFYLLGAELMTAEHNML